MKIEIETEREVGDVGWYVNYFGSDGWLISKEEVVEVNVELTRYKNSDNKIDVYYMLSGKWGLINERDLSDSFFNSLEEANSYIASLKVRVREDIIHEEEN